LQLFVIISVEKMQSIDGWPSRFPASMESAGGKQGEGKGQRRGIGGKL